MMGSGNMEKKEEGVETRQRWGKRSGEKATGGKRMGSGLKKGVEDKRARDRTRAQGLLSSDSARIRNRRRRRN